MAGNNNPTAEPWSSPCHPAGVPWGHPSLMGAWGRKVCTASLMVVGCHLWPWLLWWQVHSGATSIWLPPPPGCHFYASATSAWALPHLRRHLSLGVMSAQLPPPAGYHHLCSAATSAQLPPLQRCQPRGGGEWGWCPQHAGGCCDATGHQPVLGHPVTPFSVPSTYPGTSALAWAPRRAQLESKQRRCRRKTTNERFLPLSQVCPWARWGVHSSWTSISNGPAPGSTVI